MVKFQEGTPDTMIARLRDAISSFDKEWEKQCIPASEKQIQKLEDMVDRYHWKLPDAYLRYLRAMGREDGGLLGNEWDGCETGIDTILELFECDDDDNEAELCLEEGNFLFSHYWLDAKFCLKLSGEKAEPTIIRHRFEDPEGEYVADSFEKYLFRQAFKRYQTTFAYHVSDYRSICDHEERGKKEECRNCTGYGKTEKERMEFVRQHVEAYGLEREWFSDRINFFWHNDRYALEINVRDGFRIQFSYNDTVLKEQEIKFACLNLQECREWLFQYITS